MPKKYLIETDKGKFEVEVADPAVPGMEKLGGTPPGPAPLPDLNTMPQRPGESTFDYLNRTGDNSRINAGIEGDKAGFRQIGEGWSWLNKAKTGDERAAAGSHMLRGGMQVMGRGAPAMAAYAPVQTAAGFLLGGAGELGGQHVASWLGGGPGAQALTGDIAALLLGGKGAKAVPGGGPFTPMTKVPTGPGAPGAGMRGALGGLWEGISDIPVVGKVLNIPTKVIKGYKEGVSPTPPPRQTAAAPAIKYPEAGTYGSTRPASQAPAPKTAAPPIKYPDPGTYGSTRPPAGPPAPKPTAAPAVKYPEPGTYGSTRPPDAPPPKMTPPPAFQGHNPPQGPPAPAPKSYPPPARQGSSLAWQQAAEAGTEAGGGKGGGPALTQEMKDAIVRDAVRQRAGEGGTQGPAGGGTGLGEFNWRTNFADEAAQKAYLNNRWHALLKDMDLPGSPAGAKAPSANAAAEAAYGKKWMDLTPDQMEALTLRVIRERIAPGTKMTPPPE